MVPAIRIRPLGFDDNGDPLPGDPDLLTIDGCSFAPRTSDDINDPARAGVVVGQTLLAPYGADIVHTDQIQDPDGVVWEVDGEVGRWQSRWNDTKFGLTVALKRAKG